MKLLMHMCCGPCAVYPSNVLTDEGIVFEGIFHNPNIHPKEEYDRRLENVKLFTSKKGIPLSIIDDYRQTEWQNFSGQEEQRCNMCYAVRLDEVAKYAKEHNFDAFTTSLLVSPYQKHEVIKALGEKAEQKYGVEFYYRDFRPGFRLGQQQAKELELYRQKYCGCILSKQS